MLKHRLLAALTLLFLLLGFLCVSALEERDESYPTGCTSPLTLDVTQASATAADLVGTLESWAASADASLYLVRVANGDYATNRDLVALGGPERDRPTRPIR